jgi:hypothetical protein
MKKRLANYNFETEISFYEMAREIKSDNPQAIFEMVDDGVYIVHF